MNQQKLKNAIMILKQRLKSNPIESIANAERLRHKEYYRNYSKDRIIAMSNDDFSEYISQLWSMIMWGNKNHIIEKICSDNGFDNIKSQIAELLYGHDDISKRWDNFRTSVKHIGPATMSELLSYTNSKKFAIFNKTTITAFEYLEIPNMPKYTYQYTSDKYLYICKNIKNIANILTQEIGVSFDLLDTDYFLWDIVLPLAEEHNLISSAADECSEELPPSMHDVN